MSTLLPYNLTAKKRFSSVTNTIMYHNPNCSKSRQTLPLLRGNKIAHPLVIHGNQAIMGHPPENVLEVL